jgi:DNA primase
MEISQIKSGLSILSVLAHYGLKPDKHHRLCCPFHEDKTASMQVYPKTNTFCCFSANCSAGTGDAIQFIELMDKQGKHQAILKAQGLVNPLPISQLVKELQQTSNKALDKEGLDKEDFDKEEFSRSAVVTKGFKIFVTALRGSQKARAYLQSRNLPQGLEVGYTSGSFLQYSKALTDSFERVGLISKSHFSNGYSVFAKNSLVFPLKDSDSHVVGLYFRSIEADAKNKHFYLKDRSGLYPSYPKVDTKVLILTESVIDAASLAHYKLPFEKYSILALYGSNGWTDEHQQAIEKLSDLEQLILFLDGDSAGRKASQSLKFKLQSSIPQVQVSIVETPEGEDINSLSKAYDVDFFIHLLTQTSSESTPQPMSEPSSERSSSEPSPESEPEKLQPEMTHQPQPPAAIESPIVKIYS